MPTIQGYQLINYSKSVDVFIIIIITTTITTSTIITTINQSNTMKEEHHHYSSSSSLQSAFNTVHTHNPVEKVSQEDGPLLRCRESNVCAHRSSQSSSWSGQGLSPARSELPGQGLAQVLEGRHLRHVDVLVGVGAVDVQLPGVHLTPVGLEGGVVVGDPLRVAVLVRAHRVAHDADVSQDRVHAVVSGNEGGSRVLAEHRRFPLQTLCVVIVQ